MSARTGGRIVVRANPLRTVFSAGPWAGAAYLLTGIATGLPMFVLALVGLVVGGVLGIFSWFLVPMLALVPLLWRGLAGFERCRLRLVDKTRYPTPFRTPDADRLRARIGQRWRDPATERSAVYLILLAPLLWAADLAALVVWLVTLGGISFPLWYWAPPQRVDGHTIHGIQFGTFPHGPHGPGAHGIWVGTLPAALVAATVALVLFVGACYLVELAALGHARLAQALLTRFDPLADAKAVLDGPGPLADYPPVLRHTPVSGSSSPATG